MRTGSLIGGIVLLGVGLLILVPSIWAYNLSIQQASSLGASPGYTQGINAAFTVAVGFGGIITFAGAALTANGFRKSVPKFSVDDLQKLGLTAQKNQTATLTSQAPAQPVPTLQPIRTKTCAACGTPAFSEQDTWCRKCGKSI